MRLVRFGPAVVVVHAVVVSTAGRPSILVFAGVTFATALDNVDRRASAATFAAALESMRVDRRAGASGAAVVFGAARPDHDVAGRVRSKYSSVTARWIAANRSLSSARL